MKFVFYQFVRMRLTRYAYSFARSVKQIGWKHSTVFALSPFSFQQFGVSDEELRSKETVSDSHENPHNWEFVYEGIKVQRRKLDEKGELYEYKCTGSYSDISPATFVEAQIDVDYRLKWDDNVISLEVLEDDAISDSQVVKWVAKFPYPMYPRVYIYVRRKVSDPSKKHMVIVAKSLDDEKYPSSGKHVRVSKYKSKMIVKAHKGWYDKGLDYALIYYNDPKSSFPTIAYNWIVRRGGPYFMEKIYKAAKELESNSAPPKSDQEVPNVIVQPPGPLSQSKSDAQVDSSSEERSDESIVV